MNVLGMGPMELLMIVVIAMVVFGPQELPRIMAQIGKAVGDFRRATQGLTDEFNRTLQAELAEAQTVANDLKSTIEPIARVDLNGILSVSGTTAASATAVAEPTILPPATNGQVPPPAPATPWTWDPAKIDNTGPASPTPVPAPVVPSPPAPGNPWTWEVGPPAPSIPVADPNPPDPKVANDGPSTSAPHDGGPTPPTT